MRASGGLALLAAGSLACAAEPGLPAGEQARAFLQRYAQLTATADVAALDLYRDDARIAVSVWQGGQEVERSVAPGKAWKAQLRAGWFDGTARLEAARFQDASVTPQGARLVIQAKRYAPTRCYWDPGYAVVIEPDRHGHYQIAEERLTFLRDAVCASATAAAPVPAPQSWALPAAAAAGAAASLAAVPSDSLPPNVVPSGQGLPRLPAAGGARPAAAPATAR